jgi:DNA-binding transcriptional LysR family regulator
MHATLRQLETLRIFALTLSVTETARLTHVSQPATSQTLKELEAQFGFAIYTRSGSRVLLTAEVMQILPEVDRLLATFSTLQGRVSEQRDLRAGSVSIIAGPTQALDLLPRAILAFRNERPHVRVHLQVSAEFDMAIKVRDEMFDLGFGFYPNPETRVANQPIIETELICVMRKDHPLARHSTVDPRQMAGHTVVVVQHDMGVMRSLQELLQAALPEENVLTTNQSIAAFNMARQGGAIAVLHPLGIPEVTFDLLHLARFDPKIVVNYALYYSRRRPLSRISSRFMLAIRDSAKVHAGLFASIGFPFQVTM